MPARIPAPPSSEAKPVAPEATAVPGMDGAAVVEALADVVEAMREDAARRDAALVGAFARVVGERTGKVYELVVTKRDRDKLIEKAELREVV